MLDEPVWTFPRDISPQPLCIKNKQLKITQCMQEPIL